MPPEIALFVSLFVTLLAIINPLEALPVYLGLIEGKPEDEQRRVAQRACFYALLLSLFFLLFGTLLLRAFDVPLSMVSRRGDPDPSRVRAVFPFAFRGDGFAERFGKQRRRLRSPCLANHVRARRHRHGHQHGFNDQAV